MDFNPAEPTVLHIDINSCFATIEQQANPFLRGKPVAVAVDEAYYGCILAASTEAKKFGIKTGFRVAEAKKVCPQLIVMTPDPAKYRFVHIKLKRILQDYTTLLYPKSIDEFVLYLKGFPCMNSGILTVGQEIKDRIKTEIGEAITVSIGIGPSRFLAKTAAGIKKPDGLEILDKTNFLEVYSKLQLRDLNGISFKNELRLKSQGIRSVLDFYNADVPKLKRAFSSILGYYWYVWLRGWDLEEEFSTNRRSFGNSYVLPKAVEKNEALPILQKLTDKMASRMRKAGYQAGGIHLAVVFGDTGNSARSFAHRGEKLTTSLFDGRALFTKALEILNSFPDQDIKKIAISVFNLTAFDNSQLELFSDIPKNLSLITAVDNLNKKWGNFAITPARMMLGAQNAAPDRIAFGNVREL